MNRILICGANGLLGQKISTMLNNKNHEVLSTSVERTFVLDKFLFDYNQLDITERSDTKSLISSFMPNVIINAAAATNVDWCENNKEEAWKANVTAVENLIDAARKVNAQLIHVSTDYIFDGKNGPYREDAPPNPIGYYGRTKLASENALKSSDINYAIVRTNVLYGYGIGIKANFPLWVIESLKNNKTINVVDDQFGNPTYVGDLASAIIKIFELNQTGVFNVAGAEQLSRYDFAKQTADVFNLNSTLINKIKTSDLKQTAPRPMRSGLIIDKAQNILKIKFCTVKEGLEKMKNDMINISLN